MKSGYGCYKFSGVAATGEGRTSLVYWEGSRKGARTQLHCSEPQNWVPHSPQQWQQSSCTSSQPSLIFLCDRGKELDPNLCVSVKVIQEPKLYSVRCESIRIRAIPDNGVQILNPFCSCPLLSVEKVAAASARTVATCQKCQFLSFILGTPSHHLYVGSYRVLLSSFTELGSTLRHLEWAFL